MRTCLCIILLSLAGTLFLPCSGFCSQPDHGAVLVADIFCSDPADGSAVKNLFLLSIRSGMKGKLTCVNDRKSFSSESHAKEDYASDEFLRSLCVKGNAGWIIFGALARDEDGLSCRIYLYDYSRSESSVLSYDAVSSLDDLKNLISRDMGHIYILISASGGYFLHKDSLRYLRDQSEFGFTGGILNLNNPYGLFISGDDHLFCAAAGSAVEWDAGGRVVRTLSARGSHPGEYTSAMKIWLDDSGTVFLSDISGKLICYPRGGKFSEIELGSPPPLCAVSTQGTVFVYNKSASSLRIISRKGDALAAVSLTGETPYALVRGKKNILLLAGKENDLFVDSFSADGRFLGKRVLPFKSDDFVITSFREDSAGSLFFLDMMSKLVIKVAPDNSVSWIAPISWAGPFGPVGNPIDLEVSSDGRTIYISDALHRRVVVFGDFSGSSFPEGDKSLASALPGIKDLSLKLALCGEILKTDPMNRTALAEYIRYYASIEGFRQAMDLYKKYPEPEAALAGTMADLSVRFYIREGDGYARIFAETSAEKNADPAVYSYYYEQSLRQYQAALKLAPSDPLILERIAALKDHRVEKKEVPSR